MLFWIFYSSKNPKIYFFNPFPQKYLAAKLFSTLIIIRNVYYYDFWRSRDTEDWSNDAENTDLITEINYIWTDFQIKNMEF